MMWLQTCQKMVMWLALTVDRVSPRAERASKLASLVLRIVCGLYIQKGRVGLDWPIKRLGCTRGPSWFKDSRKRVGPRILKWILPFASPSQSRPRPPEPSRRRRRRLEESSRRQQRCQACRGLPVRLLVRIYCPPAATLPVMALLAFLVSFQCLGFVEG